MSSVLNDSKKQKNGSKKEETGIVDYDQLLSTAGFGKYQYLLCLAIGPFYTFGAFSYFSQIFITESSPNHWCWIPALENLTALDRRNFAIPNDTDAKFGYSQCSAYIANWSDVISSGAKPTSTWKTEPCQYGWEFNKSEIPYPTISSEMGWVCERDSYQATAQSVFFVGSIVGGFFIGSVADRFGRIAGTVVSNMIGCIAGIVSIFVTNFVQFAICRFFMGMSYDNCMIMAYILIVESVGPEYRVKAANIPFGVFFALSLSILPWIALACGDWRVFSLATSIPMALSLLAPFILPESPRWLLSRGRTEEAVEKIRNIAKMNKKEIPQKIIDKFKLNVHNQLEEKGSIIDILKRPLLRNMFICMCTLYVCDMIVFDTLVRTMGQLQFDFYLSFSIISFTEFPSMIILSFILDRTGRKWLTLITLAVNCLFTLMITFVGGGLPSVLCAVIARFAINFSCNIAMQWATEVLPTSVRASGSSIVHIFGYIGTVISPFIVYLNTVAEWLPLVIVAALAIVGLLCSLGLPETAKKEMPQTIEDAETLIRMSPILEMPCLKKASNNCHVNRGYELD